MSSTQRSEQSEGAAASYASSSSKSSADWQKYYDLLVKRRDTAVNPSNKAKSAAWWNFFDIVLVKDPVTRTAANVLLKCMLCDQQLSSSNTSRIAESHLLKGGCPKINAMLGLLLRWLIGCMPRSQGGTAQRRSQCPGKACCQKAQS